MSEIPSEIMDKLNKTKYITLAPAIKYHYNTIAIINKQISIKEWETIPYKFILDGEDAISSFFSAIGFHERLLDQSIGFFCHSIQEIVAITAAIKEVIPGNTHQFRYGYSKSLTLTEDQLPFQRILNKMESFEIAEQFAASLYPTATVWYPGNKRPRFHICVIILYYA